jgi:hypothetical protein
MTIPAARGIPQIDRKGNAGMKARESVAAIAVACAVAAPHDAAAFKLQAIGVAEKSPIGHASRQAQGFLSLFNSDVHERITRQAYAKAGVPLSDEVIAGVRWNDNPPAMRLGPLSGSCDMRCWTSMLRLDRTALEILGRREQTIPTLRSHFGDMQFLHAMAVRSGESALDTREKALRWAEFSYRVARGEIEGRANVYGLRDAASTMDPATRDWVSALFRAPDKKLWRVQDVFLPKSGELRLVAFGTLLHLVEDSYSASHVRRVSQRVQANGCPSYDAADPIVEFRTYVGQDTEKHAVCDDAPDWLESPRAGSPIDVLAELVRAYADGRDWPYVKAILEGKVFRLADRVAPARPGSCFESAPDAMLAGPSDRAPTALDAHCRDDAK